MVDSKTHLMTVDVEDWFQVFYGESLISKEEWNQQESKIEQMLEALLELFEHHQIKATFFVVGWLAEKKPSLIRKLHEVGHEIASHSYWHQPVFQLSQTAFSEDITRAKQVLEQAIGHQVYGFRAPGYSIDSKNPWALDEIIKAGYLYDSSLLHQPLQFCEMSPGFFEISPNALKLGSSYLPINGGFVFRCLPYFIYWIYIQWLQKLGKSLNFYIHSWEAYPHYPKIPIKGPKYFVQYFNVNHTPRKLAQLIQHFPFTSIYQKYHALFPIS